MINRDLDNARCCTNEHRFQIDSRCVIDDDLRRQEEYFAKHTITEQFADASKAMSGREKLRTITHSFFRAVDGNTAAQLLRDGVETGTEDDGAVIFLSLIHI